MLSAVCPQCGRPAPVSLAALNVLRCPACRYTGAMPADTAQNLYAAAQILQSSFVGERQLSAAQQRAVGSASSQNVLYFLVLGISALPTFCLAVAQIGLNIEEDSEDWIQASVLLITPFLVVMGVGLFIFYKLVQRRRQLQDACAATPPAVQGEPCTCHVCGAPLTVGKAAVSRCPHCSADNVVAASVVERATRQRRHVVADYATHLQKEIATVNAVANRATLLSFAGALLLPPATVILLVLIVFPLILISRPADPTVRYTHEKRAAGECLAKVTMKRAGGAKLHFSTSRDDEESYVDIDSLEGRPVLHAQDLVGREVVVPDEDVVRGKVVSVHSDVITGNHVDIQPWKDGAFDGKRLVHPTPEACCFFDPKAAPPSATAAASTSSEGEAGVAAPDGRADAGGPRRPTRRPSR